MEKSKIVDSLKAIGLGGSDESKFVILRQNRGRLIKRPAGGGLDVVANGRRDWIGWLELKKEAVNDVAVQMTGKVVQELNAASP